MTGNPKKREIRMPRVTGLHVSLACCVLLALLSTACVAGREDALAMRDEKMYGDVTERMNEARDESVSPARVGEALKEWENEKEFDDANSITLAECFRLALNRSEELLIQGEQLFETWTYEKEAISSLLPSIAFNGTFSRDSKEVKWSGFKVSPRDSAEYWFSAKQTIFDGRAIAAVPAARAASRIEELNLRDRRDRLLYSVAAAFYEILGLEQDVKVFEASLDSAVEFHRVVEARREIGEASRQDALSAKAQRDDTESQLIRARHDLEIAKTRLARLVCIETLPRTLIDTYETAYTPDLIPVLKDAAVTERADLEAARAGVELAEAKRMAALSDYLPVVTADLTRWIKREGAFNKAVDWNLSLDLTWNLFDSFGREARQARALSGVRQQELTVQALERQVRNEVEDAVLSYDSLTQVLVALRSRADASRAALDLATAEYDADEATNLDVQIARRAWEEAARDLSRAELAQKLAALKIQLVCGRFRLSEPLTEAVEIAAE